ncbi:single-stranded DNA-binding protein [Croceimicrobium sp.]|uniref:single-stranded DNA-binding protein n=1 Tax=Croceimicrobium sp. TaxID=2828340 RepID=UPI003BA91AB1
MSSVNKVILIGNAGSDPEIKSFDNGGKIARLPLATSEKYTNRNGEKVTSTEWHNLIFRGGIVGVVEKFVSKGDKLFIEGSIKTRSWTDRSTNTERYTTEIVVLNMQMLSSRQSGQAQNGGYASPQANQQRQQPAAQQQAQNQGSPVTQGQNRSLPSYDSSVPNPFDEDDDDLPF